MPKISKFNGINNVATPSAAASGDLQVATNVYIDEARVINNRTGFDSVYTGMPRSLNSESGTLLFVDGTSLYKFASGAATEVVGNLTTDKDIACVSLDSVAYITNGYQSLTCIGENPYSWGIAAPAAPTVVSASGGTLTPGKYQVVLTYARGAGLESCASVPVTCTVAAGHGTINISVIVPSTDVSVTRTNIYITGLDSEIRPDGSGLKFHSYVAAAATTASVTSPAQGQSCVTFNTSVPPVGTIVKYYRGRIYIVSANSLIFTKTWMYHHVDNSESIFMFPTNIRNVMPVDDGIWITTVDETLFLEGKDPVYDGGFTIKNRYKRESAAGGVVVSSEETELRGARDGLQAMWVSDNGVLLGDNDGKVFQLTANRWKPASLATGWGTAYSGQYVFSLNGTTHTMNIGNWAICTYSNAFTSMAVVAGVPYATTATDILVGGQADDDGVAITTTITKTGIGGSDIYLKRFVKMYIHAATATAMTATVASGSGSSAVSSTTPGASTMRGHKVNIARGLYGRNFSVNLAGTAPIILHELDIDVETSSTRPGRENRG